MVPRCEHTSEALRYGTCSQEISDFYLHTPRSSANGMNHMCLFLPSQSWSSFTDLRRVKSLVGLGGWVTCRDKCLALGIGPGHSHPSKY